MEPQPSSYFPGISTTGIACRDARGLRLPSAPRRLLSRSVAVAILSGAAVTPAAAQQLEEVIVTATKRAESVMDVPIAITAMSGAEIRKVNLSDIKDLISFTPGISGNSKDSFLDFVSVRGIRTIDFGNGGDPSVSLYKNGLYQGRNGAAVSSLYDIERAEVLRGPQGFLFGRNSVSGAMNIITEKPDVSATEGYAEIDVGERGVLTLEGAVNLPITENLAVRIAGFHSEEDGYVDNLAGGDDLISHDNQSLRITTRYENEKLTADLILEFDDRNQFGSVYRATGEGTAFKVNQTRINGGVPIETSADGRTVNNDNSMTPRDDSDIFSVGLLVDFDLGWATLTSLTGYKDHEYEYLEDYDGLPTITFNYGQSQSGEYFEQELRLASNSEGPLDWYAGASLYDEDIDTIFLGQQEEDVYCLGYWFNTCSDLFDYYNGLDSYYGQTTYCDYYLDYYFGSCEWTPSPTGLINDRNRVVGKYQGYSAYLDLGYRFSETLDGSLGVRYSYDEKDFSQNALPDPGGSLLRYKVQTGFSTPEGALRDKQDWSEVTWRAVLNWRPSLDTLLFASVATGYKPGGFGSFNIEGPGSEGCPFGLCVGLPGRDRPGDFGPETVLSYEIGYKGTLWDGRAQVATTAFYYEYEDLQAIFGEGPRTLVDNVGEVEGMGVEVEASVALTDHLKFRTGGSWFDSEATNVQAFCGAGETLTGSADVCEGNSVPWAPEYTAFVVLDANYPLGNGEAFGTIAWSWEDDYRGDWPDKDLIYQRIKALNQTDIIVGYRQSNWQVSAYVENVFDDIWYDGNYSDDPSETTLFVQHTFGPSRPRTAGVRLSYTF
ncbi:TonB-dependent receptor [Haliea sp. E1-2-M8]|uniref:TonB-dependent receptor n=1 Tax=Haliea sp. E1-2-M8 TaxID=3064706 RepID=UPI00271FF7FA|nr:TonB-dependent receptor [Haliea sp. E1-2-M8]MDO8860127.1 TonB-dependent receptor [Haliea sp. E1-2-M8]